MSRVAILDTGIANLASIIAAFRRLRADVAIVRGPDEASDVTHLVLPGVGAFGAGVERLRAQGLDELVRSATRTQTPLLAVCLGMQLLCEGSDESPRVGGLGIVPGICRRLPDTVPVPQRGWNSVQADLPCRWLASGAAAFANSYYLAAPPPGASVAWCKYGVPFVAGFEHQALLACQFHPELSGPWGLALLDRWLRRAPLEAQPAATTVSGAMRRIIPCLDVRDGRVVKGVRFQNLHDAGDPAERAREYERQGADEIVLLDITASPESRGTRLDTVRRVRAALSISLTVGGGVRGAADARALLDAGADRVSVDTAAVARPLLIADLAEEFGTQCVVLAVDARRNGTGWEVLVMGGRESTGLDAVRWAEQGVSAGAGEVLLTSWDRDGTGQGCDVDLLRAASAAVPAPVIASGGVGRREDVYWAFVAGADAVLAASVLHDGVDTVRDIKLDLARRGVTVRL